MQTNSPENTEFRIEKLELNFVLQYCLANFYILFVSALENIFSAGFFEVIINYLWAYFMLC